MADSSVADMVRSFELALGVTHPWSSLLHGRHGTSRRSSVASDGWNLGSPPRTVFDESWYTFDAVASFDGVRVAGVLLVHLLALAMWPSPWWAGLAGLLVAVDGVHIVHVHLHHRWCPLRRARVPAAATASRSRPWPATGSSGPATCSGPACCWGRRGDQVDGAARPGSRDRPWGGRRAQPARAESSAPLSWPLLAHPIRYVWDSAAAGRSCRPATRCCTGRGWSFPAPGSSSTCCLPVVPFMALGQARCGGGRGRGAGRGGVRAGLALCAGTRRLAAAPPARPLSRAGRLRRGTRPSTGSRRGR
jgi:hypothetical protein